MSRTVVDFVPHTEPWPVVDAWAARGGWSVANHGAWGRAYRKGDGFIFPVMYVQIDALPVGLRLSAWVPFAFSGDELDIHTNGFVAFAVRRQLRKRVNDLLAGLGGPRIGK